MSAHELNGSIYVIGCPEPMAIKVGFTTKSPLARLKQLQTGNPQRLILLGWYPGNVQQEREIHAQLAEFRLSGEWFRVDPAASEALRVPIACVQINNALTGYSPEPAA